MKESYLRRIPDILVCVGLAIIAVVVYRKVLRLWWMYDDAYLIRIVREVSPWALLHDRAFYAQLGRPIFNPLLMISWKFDVACFGSNTAAFYWHQLIAFALIPVLLYVFFRLWSSRIASAAAATIFTIGCPTLTVAPQLMLRHYVEGAVFALVAVILFVLAVRRESWALAIASAFFYFCASAAKEVYAPLILILIAIPEGRLRLRTRFAAPHIIAAGGFVLWRSALIGSSIGPFGILPPHGKWLISILTIPFRTIRQFAGSGSPLGWIMLASVMLCTAIVLLRSRHGLFLSICALIAVIAPLVPVCGEMQARWGFAAWLLAVAPIAFLPAAFPRAGSALAVVILIVALITQRVEWPIAYRLFARMSDEARVFANLHRGDMLRNMVVPPAAISEIGRMTASPARAINDDLPLCDSDQPVGRIVEYDPARREVVEVARSTVYASCRANRTMHLMLRLNYDADGAFYWTLGPYRDGSYAFIIGNGGFAFDVPREAGFRGPGLDRFNLRVRYTSPAGWKTYSTVLSADSRKPTLTFQR